MLSRISKISNSKAIFIADLFEFDDGAQSLKGLGRKENRQNEIAQKLRIKSKYTARIINSRIAIIDDVVTTGSTFEGAFNLLNPYSPERIIGICLAKTVSISPTVKYCPHCSRLMKLRRNQKTELHFWACSGYFEVPQCKHCENLKVKDCPKCGSLMHKKANNNGGLFLACEGYYTSKNCKHTEDIS